MGNPVAEGQGQAVGLGVDLLPVGVGVLREVGQDLANLLRKIVEDIFNQDGQVPVGVIGLEGPVPVVARIHDL